MTERVLHDRALVHGVADQVTDARKARSGQVRHDRLGVRYNMSEVNFDDN